MSARSVVGRVFGVIGSFAVVGGVFLKWDNGTSALRTSINRLVSAQPQPTPHQITQSMGLVFVALAFLLLVCSLFGRRMLTFFLGFCTLATVLLWGGLMFLYEQPRSFGPHNVQTGAWVVVGGALLCMIGSRVLPKRRKD